MRIIRIMIATALIFACMSASAAVKAERVPEVMLVSVYRQTGLGGLVQIGAIDTDGRVWYAEFDEGTAQLPSDPAGMSEFVAANNILIRQGELDWYDTDRIRSLILGLEASEAKAVPAADGAGIQESFAFCGNGDAPVVLGVSGDELYENTAPEAQELYLILRRTFPDLTSYYGEEGISPIGFRPVPLLAFLGRDDIDISRLTLKTFLNDCEAGPIEVENDISLSELLARYVTGKESCVSVTGGFYSYDLFDADGEFVFSVSLYKGLLYTNDGMYRLGAPE